MPNPDKTMSLAQLRHQSGPGGLKKIGTNAGLARTVLYRMLNGGGITLGSAIKLTRAYPVIHFRVGRRKYIIREV